MTKFKLRVVCPERIILEGEVLEVTLPTKSGQITILNNHAPLISELGHGDIIIRDGKQEQVVLVYGGFVHIKERGNVIILADLAEHLHEVLEKEAEEARKRAEKVVQEVRDDKERFAEAQAELARSLMRLKAIKKHRLRRRLNS